MLADDNANNDTAINTDNGKYSDDVQVARKADGGENICVLKEKPAALSPLASQEHPHGRSGGRWPLSLHLNTLKVTTARPTPQLFSYL